MRTILASTPRESDILVNNLPSVASLEVFGAHPTAAANGVDGHYVTAVYHYGDNLLMGYGDWTANTGPIDLVGLTLADASPVTLFTGGRTECFAVFREINGDLYIPWIDNRAGVTDGIGGFLTNKGGTWHEVETTGVDYVHLFDIATLDGSDLIVCGAAGPQGTIHRSTDEGATWTNITPSGVTVVRIHDILTAAATLYQPYQGQKWDPVTGWTEWGVRGRAYASLQANHPELNGWKYTRGIAINATTGEFVESGYWISPAATDGSYVYGTRWWDGCVVVLRTPGVVDGRVEWEPLISLPLTNLTPQRLVQGTSLAVHDGYIYVGGSQGRVFRTPLPG